MTLKTVKNAQFYNNCPNLRFKEISQHFFESQTSTILLFSLLNRSNLKTKEIPQYFSDSLLYHILMYLDSKIRTKMVPF